MEIISAKAIDKLKEKNDAVKEYIENLSPLEYKALNVALRELESSFSIEKSIGFIDFKKKSTTQPHKT